MTTEERFESLDSDSPNTTPRGKLIQGKSPGLVSRPSPFYLSLKKEYTTIPTGPNSGRSISSNQHDVSEAKRLYERSSTVERRDGGYEFSPETDQWTATHRYRGEEGEEEKDNFTFQDQDHDDEEIEKKDVVLEMQVRKDVKEKKKKKEKKEKKKKMEKEKETGEDGEAVQEKEEEPKKKKKKKNVDGEKKLAKKDSKDSVPVGSAEGSVERDEKVKEKKKLKKSKTKTTTSSKGSSEDFDRKSDGKSDGGDSTVGLKKKPKEMNLRQLMLSKNLSNVSNLSLSDHHEHTNDPRFHIADSLSCVSSPQSLLALTKGDSHPSPTGPQALKAPSKKKEKGSKKDRRKKYELEPKDDEKPAKTKAKKHKDHNHHRHRHHHHEDQPKRILLTDGLNLVKIMTDRTNCKKTKFFIILYTFTVLWSIVLNGLELNFFTETTCKPYTEAGLLYLSFVLAMLLKFLSVSLFNLELTYKQPYKPSIGLLYPLLAQCCSPLLQLPQNVYDFSACKENNHLIRLTQSWTFLKAIIGSMLGIALYLALKQRIDVEILKSRLGRLVNKLVKCVLILAGLAWIMVLIVVFCSQGIIFLPSLFFDFYLFVVLAVSVGIVCLVKKKYGKDGLKSMLIKDDKDLSKALAQPEAQPAAPVKEMIKIEVQS